MAAIVTNKFRINNAENFKNDLSNEDTSTYVYISKSDAWSNNKTDVTDSEAPTPLDQEVDERDIHDNIIAMKRLSASDVSHVVPRNNWTPNTTYTPWDDKDELIFDKPFYVVTDEFKVYKCIQAGEGASTIKPIHTNTGAPQTSGDGYMWKYMYTIQAAASEKFLTNFFMPIKTVIDDGNLDTDDQTQYDAQVAAEIANNGAIYRIVVEDGGTGYTSKPTVEIVGNGSGASILESDIVMEGTSVKEINISNYGSNYTQANIVISHPNGVGAVARAVLSPAKGHGSDPVKELGAFYVSTNAKLEYADGEGDFIVDNSFRQVGLIRNPYEAGSSVVSTAPTLSGLKSIKATGDVSSLEVGDFIYGETSGTYAFIDAIDTQTGTIKYHQNDKTGWGDFDDVSGEVITGNNAGSGTVVVGSYDPSEYERYSGDILFIENRDPINRYETQIEDVKIIIEF